MFRLLRHTRVSVRLMLLAFFTGVVFTYSAIYYTDRRALTRSWIEEQGDFHGSWIRVGEGKEGEEEDSYDDHIINIVFKNNSQNQEEDFQVQVQTEEDLSNKEIPVHQDRVSVKDKSEGSRKDYRADSAADLHRRSGEESGFTKVVLLSYFRGGSSFLGEIFNQNNHAFYWFEPLAGFFRHPTYYKAYNFIEDGFIRGEKATVKHIPEELSDKIVQCSLDILNCDIDKMDHLPLAHSFAVSWKKHRAITYTYQACMNKFKVQVNNTWLKPEFFGYIEMCHKAMEDLCRKLPIRVFKTIRMAVFEVLKILENDPQVKVIHYVRDPRGMLHSRSRLGWPNSQYGRVSVVRNTIQVLCDKLNDDSVYSKVFERTFPNNFMAVRYEDLAADPHGTTKAVYDFIGSAVPPEVTKWLKEATNATDLKLEHALGTRRINATETSQRWRDEMPIDLQFLFRQYCQPYLRQFSYGLDLQ